LVTRDDDAADRLRTAFVQDAATQSRPQADVRDVLDAYGNVVCRFDRRLFDIFERFDEPETADDILDLVDLDRARTDVGVRRANRLEYFLERYAVGAHRVRIDVDLVLANESSDRCDLRNSARRLQRVADDPILDAAEFVKIPTARRIAVLVATFQCVPKDLPQSGGIGAERRRHALGQRSRRKTVEFFQDSRTRPVELRVRLENHVDAREPEHRKAANGTDIRNPQQGYRQRVGDLVLNVLRRASRPIGKNDLLVLTDVRNRVDRDRTARISAEVPIEGSDGNAPRDQRGRGQDHDELLLEAKADDATEHGPFVLQGRLASSPCPSWTGTAPPPSGLIMLGLARICSALSILKAPFVTTRSPSVSPLTTM
jgi:hypothetical protein